MEKQIRKQLEAWRDSYINTSLKRNNLLHQSPLTTDAIVFDCNEYFTYEHFWKIASGAGEAEEYALQSNANPDPRYRPISWRAERAQENPKDLALLDEIVKTGYKAIVQKGENPICLTFGKLVWRVGTEGENIVNEVGRSAFTEICTPVILIPVKLNKRGVNYWLKPAYEDALVNPALVLKYAQQGYKDFPLPPCGQWLDESFDIQAYFELLATHFAEGESKFEKEYVALDVFDYDRICMYRDVARHMDELQKNPVIRALFGEKLCERKAVVGLDRLAPETSFSILDTNTSQSAVIERFNNGESFVLEGPPGTGKTQTIVNMISEAVMRNKSVLFVSGKMSALNTVMKKLQMPGTNLEKHCLLIKGEQETGEISLSDTYAKLQAAYDAPRPVVEEAEYRENIKTLKASRDILVGYNREFYDRGNSLEASPYDLIGRMLLLGYNENYVHAPDFRVDFIEKLTPDALEKYVGRMADIEKLLLAIIRKYGAVEKDVWYGYGKMEIDPKAEAYLRGYCTEFASLLKQLDEAFAAVEGLEQAEAQKAFNALVSQPLDSLRALACADAERDISALYLKGSLEKEKDLIKTEISNSKGYVSATKRYFTWIDGKSNAEPKALKKLLDEAELADVHARKKLSELAEEEAQLTGLSQKLANFHNKEGELSAAAIRELLENISQYGQARAACDELKQELSASFTDELFALNHKKLLEKFRTAWAQRVQEEKKPLFYEWQIKPVKKCCKDIVNADFSLQAVYGLLEKLDLYHRNARIAADRKTALDTRGFDGFTANASALERLASFFNAYLAEREDFALDSFITGENSFEAYLKTKLTALKNIRAVAEALHVQTDVTAGELNTLVNDHKLVCKHNARIAKNAALCDVLPSIEKNVRTDWNALLATLSLIERARGLIRDEKRTVQEDCAVFTQLVQALASEKLQTRIAAVLRKYEQFYANREYFDPKFTDGNHSCAGFTLADFKAWHADVSDFKHFSEFVSYRKRVKSLDRYGKAFFEWYAKEGRKDYPLEKLRDHYEVCILHAYYTSLIKKSKYLAKLTGNDGITTVKTVVDRFAAADLKALTFNRKLLDNKFYAGITRSAQANGNLHNYLRSMPKGANASVRRLFKTRSESIRQLAPCLMMSVYSVSKLLEYEQYQFDVVIFDEASQIPIEDALTSLMRAKRQVVIAGDPKQMPAISYFKTRSEGVLSDDEEIETCSSVIDFVIRAKHSAIAYERLDMHYRSNHESLIKYSNENPLLYSGNLVTFPSPKARTEDFGLWNYCLLDDERYQGQTLAGGGGENAREAERVLELIKRHFTRYPVPKASERENYPSLGVIVFGTKQKKRILAMMEADKSLRAIAALHDNRVFFISTADEIQGDEASEMILSLTYGRDEKGKLSQAWGHLNQHPVALYKFNVAVTRARDNLKFVHSVRHNEITNENLGYIADYLRQFEVFAKEPFTSHREYNTKFVEAIGKICESVVGKDRVVYNYGESPRSYRVPISILSRDGQSVALGVLCEQNRGGLGSASAKGVQGAASGQGFSVREYCRTCNKILEAHDWTNLYETYAMQWIRNYNFEKRCLIERLNEIL